MYIALPTKHLEGNFLLSISLLRGALRHFVFLLLAFLAFGFLLLLYNYLCKGRVL